MQTDINNNEVISREAKIIGDDNVEITIDFDDLERVKSLGNGQYGYVTKRRHTISDTFYAVKRIDIGSDYYKQQSQIMDVYVPMRTNSRNSPYLVKYYGAICAEASIWILNELMNTSLDKFYVRSHELFKLVPECFISKVANAVLNAVHHLKESGIMHRDIKPSNILVNRKGEIKLCDFGVSGVLVNSTCETRQRGSRLYMAPEKLNPENNDRYNVKSDVWSLGISLIEIATGLHPYENHYGFFAIAGIVVDGEQSPTLPEGFSTEFSTFVTKCLKKKIDERASHEELLSSEFIILYLNSEINYEMLKQVLDSIDEDEDDD